MQESSNDDKYIDNTKLLISQLNNILNRINVIENIQNVQFNSTLDKINHLENKLLNKILDVENIIQQHLPQPQQPQQSQQSQQSQPPEQNINISINNQTQSHDPPILQSIQQVNGDDNNNNNNDDDVDEPIPSNQPQQLQKRGPGRPPKRISIDGVNSTNNTVNTNINTNSNNLDDDRGFSGGGGGGDDDDNNNNNNNLENNTNINNNQNNKKPTTAKEYLVQKMLSMKRMATLLIKFKQIQNDDISDTLFIGHQKEIESFIDDIQQDITQQLEANHFKDIQEVEKRYEQYIEEKKKNRVFNFFAPEYKTFTQYVNDNDDNISTKISQSDLNDYLFLKSINKEEIKVAIEYIRHTKVNCRIKRLKPIIMKNKCVNFYFPGTPYKYATHFKEWYQSIQNVSLFLSAIFTFPIEELTTHDLEEFKEYFKFYTLVQPNTKAIVSTMRNRKRKLATLGEKKNNNNSPNKDNDADDAKNSSINDDNSVDYDDNSIDYSDDDIECIEIENE